MKEGMNFDLTAFLHNVIMKAMENGTTPNIIPPHKSNSFIIILSLLMLIGGSIFGYFVKSFTTPKNTVVEETALKTEPGQSTFSNITYLQQFFDTKSHSNKTILVTNESDITKLILTEDKLTPEKFKVIHSFSLPGALEFTPPGYYVDNYIIFPYGGGDSNDLVIFSLDGSIITTNVVDSNPELNGWLVTYSGIRKEPNQIKLSLFKIDGSVGEVMLDITTGKIIPGTLKTS